MSKKFVGNVKVINTKFGEMLKISISEKDFQECQKNGWLNMLFKKTKDGRYYLENDDWTPEKAEPSHEPKNSMSVNKEKLREALNNRPPVDGSLPF